RPCGWRGTSHKIAHRAGEYRESEGHKEPRNAHRSAHRICPPKLRRGTTQTERSLAPNRELSFGWWWEYFRRLRWLARPTIEVCFDSHIPVCLEVRVVGIIIFPFRWRIWLVEFRSKIQMNLDGSRLTFESHLLPSLGVLGPFFSRLQNEIDRSTHR